MTKRIEGADLHKAARWGELRRSTLVGSPKLSIPMPSGAASPPPIPDDVKPKAAASGKENNDK